MNVNRLYNVDCRQGLLELEDDSIDCVITSPPYWNLRDYNVEGSIWDGDPECEHEFDLNESKINGQMDYSNSGLKNDGRPEENRLKTNENMSKKRENNKQSKEGFCVKCGAWKGCLGLEPDFNLYVKHLCDIFDLIKQKLKKTGTCWINIGDTYSSKGGLSKPKHLENANVGNTKKGIQRGTRYFAKNNPIKDKCLCMIPQRFALEMINRGWILRNVIIWHKNNCMPSSARDRFTVDFEYVYFFVKSKKYWFDQDAVREPPQLTTLKRIKYPHHKTNSKASKGNYAYDKNYEYNKNQLSQGRNKRCVWTVNTRPNPEAHFATFPSTLVNPMILAGCPEYICRKCGKSRTRIIDNSTRINTRCGKNVGNLKSGKNTDPNKDLHNSDLSKYRQKIIYKTISWSDCGCNEGFKPGIVLDIFAGTGTTLLEAWKQGRNYIGFEISKEYCEIANKYLDKETKYVRMDHFIDQKKV